MANRLCVHVANYNLKIGEPALAFSREQLRNPHFSGAYRTFQNSVAVLLGADSVQSDVDMAKVFEFERTLVNVSTTSNSNGCLA